jgi:hypothetical protein
VLAWSFSDELRHEFKLADRCRQHKSVMDKCRHFNFDQSRHRRESRNLHESTSRTRCAECFLVCSRDMIGISKINGINDGTDNMAQLRASLTQCRGDRCDGGPHLNVGIGF